MKKIEIAGAPLARALAILAGSLAGPNPAANTPDEAGRVAGFWLGLWHGMIAPVTFVISLFARNVHVYEVHNNGNWYLFGFLLGLVSFWGGRQATSAGRRRAEKSAGPQEGPAQETKFLDMQAEIGVSKHIGGHQATDELLALCHIEDAREVLNVGCGIGAGSTYVAKKYGCHVVGVDISEKMVQWSRQRARAERIEYSVEFRAADVLSLPFEADRFDVVFAESVLIFVEDKAQAIRECVRVTKPGGYVGLNEGFWTQQPPPELMAVTETAVGPDVPTLEAWQALWEGSGLEERVLRTRQIDPRAEVKSRIDWIGWPWLLRAWVRGLRLYLTNPAVRQSIKNQLDVPPEAFRYLGYALLAGKKEAQNNVRIPT